MLQVKNMPFLNARITCEYIIYMNIIGTAIKHNKTIGKCLKKSQIRNNRNIINSTNARQSR